METIRHERRHPGFRHLGALTVFGWLLTGALPAVAQSGSFLGTEVEVLGAGISTTWQQHLQRNGLGTSQIGGQGLGRQNEFAGAADERGQGPTNLGEKVRACLLSAALPGAGQFYNGQRGKAYIMAGIEVGIWGAYLVFHQQATDRFDTAVDYAGTFAGTGGSHVDNYWVAVGQYGDSDAYNESLLREARALQTDPSGLISGDDAWQWVSDQRRNDYRKLRADMNSAYDRRDFMILFAVVNRVVSMVDAVLGVGAKDGVLDVEVLGLNVEAGLVPSAERAQGRLTVSRSF